MTREVSWVPGGRLLPTRPGTSCMAGYLLTSRATRDRAFMLNPMTPYPSNLLRGSHRILRRKRLGGKSTLFTWAYPRKYWEERDWTCSQRPLFLEYPRSYRVERDSTGRQRPRVRVVGEHAHQGNPSSSSNSRCRWQLTGLEFLHTQSFTYIAFFLDKPADLSIGVVTPDTPPAPIHEFLSLFAGYNRSHPPCPFSYTTL